MTRRAGRDALPPPSAGEGGPRKGSGEGSPASGGDTERGDGRSAKPSPHLRAFAREQRQLRTKAEDAFWQQVRGGRFHGLKFRRQVPIPPYITDFLCASARLIVELDGAPHEAAERRDRDAARDVWLRAQGFEILRFPNDLVLGNLGFVLAAIGAAVAARQGRDPSGGVAPLSRPLLTQGPPSPAEGGGLEPGTTRRAALRHLTEALTAADIDNPAGEARFLALDLLGLESFDLLGAGAAPIGAEGAARLADALHRRLAGEPVARILGAWEFWGLPMRLSPETLVPRPDTETLVEAALRLLSDQSAPLRILDLGTGSGCILTALLSERPAAFGLGIDRSEGALRTARANARLNGVGARAAFLAADWCDALSGPPFDLVVSNPPYIASAVIPRLAREVREHDPAAALDGGADGLDAYRRILAGLDGHLAPGAPVLFEIGFDQGAALRDLARETGFVLREIVRDLAGHERVTILVQDV